MSSTKKATRKHQSNKRKSENDSNIDIDKVFEKIDINGDGRISVRELTKAMGMLGMNPTQKEAEQVIKECNPKQEGYISKAEFKKLFVDRQANIDEEIKKLADAFRMFDKDNSGTITADEIREVLKVCGGGEVDEAEVNEMLRQADADGDGNISYEEFACVMCDIN